jgi:hypothetical protein
VTNENNIFFPWSSPAATSISELVPLGPWKVRGSTIRVKIWELAYVCTYVCTYILYIHGVASDGAVPPRWQRQHQHSFVTGSMAYFGAWDWPLDVMR